MELTFQQGEREDIRSKRNTEPVKWARELRRKNAAGRDAGDASNHVGVEWAPAKVLSRHRPKGRKSLLQDDLAKAFQTQGIGPKRGNPYFIGGAAKRPMWL